MPYSPPAGLAVNFVRDQAAYSPPPGDHVDFHGYTEASYVSIGNGKLSIGGVIDAYVAPVGSGIGVLLLSGESVVGHGISGDSYGVLLLSGVIDTEVVIPTADAAGVIVLSGVIDTTVVVNALCAGYVPWGGGIDVFTRPPQIDIECFGALPVFSGSADVRRGENTSGYGRMALGGQAAVRVGRVAIMSGKVSFGGAASVRRGERMDAYGSLHFSGYADADSTMAVICTASAALNLGGNAYLQIPIENNEAPETFFIIDRQDSIYVLGQ